LKVPAGARAALKHLVTLVPMLFGISTIVFLISHILPGDPAAMVAGTGATYEQIAAIRTELGLDRPLYEQYLAYMKKVFLGFDLGTSLYSHRAVVSDLLDYLPATFELVTVSMIMAVSVGILLGVASATKKDTVLDHFIRILTSSGLAMPAFWLGLLLQLLIGHRLGILPITGRIDAEVLIRYPIARITRMYLVDTLVTGNWIALWSATWHIAMPATVLSFSTLSYISRFVRSGLLEVLGEDHIRALRSYGLCERIIVYRHALRNAIIPTLTIVGLRYGFLLGGVIVIERVFDWPGLGLYALSSVIYLDFPSIIGVTLIFALLRIIINLLIDLSYLFVDPRVRV